MVSEVLTTLCSGHHLCEGSRCQVPATDSQQSLQVGVDLQIVEPLVPGKQHFQMLITIKLDHKLIEKRRREEEKLLLRVFFIPSPMTGHIMRPLLNWLCEQCPYLSSNCLWSLLSLLSHLKWTGGRRCLVAVATCTKQHIFSLVQQHSYLVVVPLLILLLYKFYLKNKTKFTSVLIANSLLHVYYYWIMLQTHNPLTGQS